METKRDVLLVKKVIIETKHFLRPDCLTENLGYNNFFAFLWKFLRA